MKPLFLYHASCYDGFCAAYQFWQLEPNTEFIPVNYNQDPPDVTGRDVIIADFSYKREVLLLMKAAAKSLIVLDHHKTAQDELSGLDFCIFDMEKSGARLVQEHFNLGPSWLVDYTEDRDLWKWELPHSREVSAALRSTEFDFQQWTDFENFSVCLDFKGVVQLGTSMQRYFDKLTKGAIRNAKTYMLGGDPIRGVNCTMSDIISDVAGGIAEEDGIGMTYFIDGSTYRYSLRSRGGVDVSEIAEARGGGGHKAAAGFSLDYLLPEAKKC